MALIRENHSNRLFCRIQPFNRDWHQSFCIVSLLKKSGISQTDRPESKARDQWMMDLTEKIRPRVATRTGRQANRSDRQTYQNVAAFVYLRAV